MEENQIKALISLLDDDDKEILTHVERKIITLGEEAIPHLEQAWEDNFNPKLQKRIEDLIHSLQFSMVKHRLQTWLESHQDDLLYGLWAISTYLYPDYEYKALKQSVEQLYYDVWVDFKKDLHPFDQVKAINGVFFSKLKFRANTKNFHSPNNSMINAVIESRKGNPITLCAVYMIIAQKLGLTVYGVNLPNLFVLTYKTDDIQFYVNAFNKGLIFSRADIDNFVAQLNLSPAPEYYEPCTHSSIISRILRNLIVAFDKQGDMHRIEEVKVLLNLMEDQNPTQA